MFKWIKAVVVLLSRINSSSFEVALNAKDMDFDREKKIEDGPYSLGSEACRSDHFLAPYFDYWIGKLGLGPEFHRKIWEYVYICQVLSERGFLKESACGLGFGCGKEPLVDFFASKKISILATDQTMIGEAQGWSATNQITESKGDLWKEISSFEDFEKFVRFQEIDMNKIPENLKGFDFNWSSCCFEHLGSIQRGMDFIENCLNTLRPGGLAVHTTEFNLSSDEETVDDDMTVLFRKQDFIGLAEKLRSKGHEVAPLNFYAGAHILDQHIDVPPYGNNPHLKLLLRGYNTTSIGLIVRKKL